MLCSSISLNECDELSYFFSVEAFLLLVAEEVAVEFGEEERVECYVDRVELSEFCGLFLYAVLLDEEVKVCAEDEEEHEDDEHGNILEHLNLGFFVGV